VYRIHSRINWFSEEDIYRQVEVSRQAVEFGDAQGKIPAVPLCGEKGFALNSGGVIILRCVFDKPRRKSSEVPANL